jgi:uncharacterized protein Yka (UPF0111/DUF47 family)
MHLFRRRIPRLEEHLLAFALHGEHFLAEAEEALETFLLAGQGEAFEASVKRTQQAEQQAEELHHRLRSALSAGPSPRMELAGVLDSLLGMLASAQSLLYTLRCQRLSLPPALSEDFAQLMDLNLEACRLVMQRFRAHLTQPRLRLLSGPELEALEAQSRTLSRALIFELFGASRTPASEDAAELVLRDLVLMIEALCERARRVAERLDGLSPRPDR